MTPMSKHAIELLANGPLLRERIAVFGPSSFTSKPGADEVISFLVAHEVQFVTADSKGDLFKKSSAIEDIIGIVKSDDPTSAPVAFAKEFSSSSDPRSPRC